MNHCLLAISAVYFKAKWLMPFEKEFTSDYPSDGNGRRKYDVYVRRAI
ncbi:truncated serine protease inhibitor [Vaccinia virus]|uniref:Truncated serine protease inhibitor n=1 Tax=Vaccinia virus TaxID=10245 RepID=A0A0M5M4R6_VACCV|nr:truncated serine protease inhibitor [Vaccinia virus]